MSKTTVNDLAIALTNAVAQIDELHVTLNEAFERIHTLESVLMAKQLATTKTLGKASDNYNWLVELGVNPQALETTSGQEMVEALQICEEGQWFKLRFTSAYYKAHTARCQALLKRVGDLAREQSRGSKQTKRTKENPVTWLLVAMNPQEGVSNTTQDDEVTF